MWVFQKVRKHNKSPVSKSWKVLQFFCSLVAYGFPLYFYFKYFLRVSYQFLQFKLITFRVNLPLSQGWVISKRKKKKTGSVIRVDLNLEWKAWGRKKHDVRNMEQSRRKSPNGRPHRNLLTFIVWGEMVARTVWATSWNRAHGSLRVQLHLPPVHTVYTRPMSSSKAPKPTGARWPMMGTWTFSEIAQLKSLGVNRCRIFD